MEIVSRLEREIQGRRIILVYRRAARKSEVRGILLGRRALGGALVEVYRVNRCRELDTSLCNSLCLGKREAGLPLPSEAPRTQRAAPVDTATHGESEKEGEGSELSLVPFGQLDYSIYA